VGAVGMVKEVFDIVKNQSKKQFRAFVDLNKLVVGYWSLIIGCPPSQMTNDQ
jgi:hypothetical protein